MGVEKVSIGSIPAYEIGDKAAPAVIVLQVVSTQWHLAHISLVLRQITLEAIEFRNGGA